MFIFFSFSIYFWPFTNLIALFLTELSQNLPFMHNYTVETYLNIIDLFVIWKQTLLILIDDC